MGASLVGTVISTVSVYYINIIIINHIEVEKVPLFLETEMLMLLK